MENSLQVFRRYHLINHIFRGSGHDTYLAYPLDEPGHLIVLKVYEAAALVPAVTLSDVRHMEICFHRLKHPWIVPVFELGIEQETLYVVRTYEPGGSLRQYLEQRASRPLPLTEAVGAVMQVGQALVFAHAQEILHGEIRPENILLDAAGKVLLADFRLSNLLLAPEPQDQHHPRVSGYQAPEQRMGETSAASDQYALGCLLYELLVGNLPDPTVLHQRTVQNASPILPLLPPQIKAVLLRALEYQPGKRYPDVETFLAKLKLAAQPKPPAFPFAHLTSGYQQIPSSAQSEEEFPLLLPNMPFPIPTFRHQEQKEEPTPSTELSLEAFLTSPQWDGVSLLDRLARIDGKEETPLFSDLVEMSPSSKAPHFTPEEQGNTGNETTFLDASLPKEDTSFLSSPDQETTRHSLPGKRVPSQSSSGNEEELFLKEALLFSSVLEEPEEERDRDLALPSLLPPTEEPMEAVFPWAERANDTTGLVQVQPSAQEKQVPVSQSASPSTSLSRSSRTPVQSPPQTANAGILPPLPGRKFSLTLLGVAVLLTTVASVLLSSFSAGVIPLLTQTPVAVVIAPLSTPTRIPTPKPTPIHTPTLRPTPIHTPTPKPTPIHAPTPKPTPIRTPTPKPTSIPRQPTPPPSRNYALAATPSASSSHESDGWGQTKVNDGQRTSTSSSEGWSSESNLVNNHTEWVELDLKTSALIDQVNLYPRSDASNVGQGFPVDFTIALSTDGTNWTTVVTKTGYPLPGSGTVQSFSFPAQSAHYVRVQGTSLRPSPNDYNYYRMQFAEIEVY